ncbi:MAG: hypothetical protein QOF16_643, partial [Actinomycetota bacterium]|nr:hypothetical protein [Actinomycetota bacterium]
RARQGLGFVPRHTTEETLEDFRDHRGDDFVVESSTRPTWERELFEYLKQKAAAERESV